MRNYAAITYLFITFFTILVLSMIYALKTR